MNELEPPPQINVFNWIWQKWFEQFYRWVQDNIMKDYGLEVARGNVNGISSVNKFGRCIDNVDNGVATDIWDGASAGIANIIWDAPTQARIHAIASTSANDADGGTGAYSVIVYGLTDWDTKEVSETVTLAGATPVNTVNSYVIIHRIKCIYGANSTAPNAGQISATAATDATVTAYVLAGRGQTEMAVYGVPSVQSAYVTKVWGSVNRAVAGAVNIDLLVNENADVQLLAFNRKGNWSVHSTGATSASSVKLLPEKYAGPCILKLQGTGSANNMDAAAGFDAYLVDN